MTRTLVSTNHKGGVGNFASATIIAFVLVNMLIPVKYLIHLLIDIGSQRYELALIYLLAS
jgi:hypothetical protein